MSGAHKSPGSVPSAVVIHAGRVVKILPTLLHVSMSGELRMLRVPPVPKRKYFVPSQIIDGSATPMSRWVVVVGVGPPPNGLAQLTGPASEASDDPPSPPVVPPLSGAVGLAWLPPSPDTALPSRVEPLEPLSELPSSPDEPSGVNPDPPSLGFAEPASSASPPESFPPPPQATTIAGKSIKRRLGFRRMGPCLRKLLTESVPREGDCGSRRASISC